MIPNQSNVALIRSTNRIASFRMTKAKKQRFVNAGNGIVANIRSVTIIYRLHRSGNAQGQPQTANLRSRRGSHCHKSNLIRSISCLIFSNLEYWQKKKKSHFDAIPHLVRLSIHAWSIASIQRQHDLRY